MTRAQGWSLGASAAVLIVALLVRAGWLHDAVAAEACATGGGGLDCRLRDGIGMLMHWRALGWAALGLGGVALLRPHPATAAAALGAAAVGLVFYNAELAGVGAVLGLIALARCGRRERAARE